MMEVIACTGCDRPILDKYLLNVSNQSWHADCVTCSECKVKLTDKCFTRDGKLFCRLDFFKKFGTKCAGCQQGILPSDLVRRARSKVFHLNCFKCITCRKLLSTGEELYILDENRFICKEDFLQSRYQQAVTAGVASPPEPDLDDSSTVVSPPDSEGNIKFEEDDHDDDLLSGSSSSHLGLNSMTTGNVHGHNSHTSLPPFTSSGGSSSLMGLSSKSSPMSASSSLSDSGHALTESMCAGSPGTLTSTANTTGGCTNGSSSSAPGTSGSSVGNDENTPGTKRRGPRTTIKAKQLETLKQAFSETPKPTRHIRETLASQTGLNMRVIQVWFQNRRSKERRMKQVSAMGNHRRPFFGRTPRRAMRPLRTGALGIGSHDGLDDSPEMVGGPNNAYGYFSESSNPGEFGFGGPPPGGPGHPHPPAHPGGPAGSYYDFFAAGSTGPYPGEAHPGMTSTDATSGPNAPPNATPTSSDTSLSAIESASGWPMSQI